MARSQHYATTALRLSARVGDTGIYAALRATHAMARAVRTGRPSAAVESEISAATELAQQAGDRAAAQFIGLGRVAYCTYTAQSASAYHSLSALLEQSFAESELGSYVRSIAQLTAPAVFFWHGRFRRSAEQVDDWIRAAREHADLHLEYGLRAVAAYRHLCDDEPDRAVAEWTLAAARFPKHAVFRSAFWGVVIGLYADRLEVSEHALTLASRVFWRWNVHVAGERLQHVWAYGAVAAARLARGDTRLRTRSRLSIATWLLCIERGGANRPQVHHLRAAMAHSRGRHARAVAHLEQALRGFDECEWPMFAACASRALSRLHPDAAQRHKYASWSAEAFGRERIVRPDRWESALLPGFAAARSPSLEHHVQASVTPSG